MLMLIKEKVVCEMKKNEKIVFGSEINLWVKLSISLEKQKRDEDLVC